MLKKQVFAAFVTAIMSLASLAQQASALNYTNTQGNQATFETLQEARVNGPVAIAALNATPAGSTSRIPRSMDIRKALPSSTARPTCMAVAPQPA